jgi:hypothetical protein
MLTKNFCYFVNNAQNTFLLNSALVAKMLPDQLHVWNGVSNYITFLLKVKLFRTQSMGDRHGYLGHLPVIVRVFKKIGHLNN